MPVNEVRHIPNSKNYRDTIPIRPSQEGGEERGEIRQKV